MACTTKVSGLQVASVVDGHLAVKECRATGGTGHLVSDEDVRQIQKELAREEGIITEPAGAVALTGALQAVRNNEIPADSVIVSCVTGSGFKDMAAVERMTQDFECPMLDAAAIDAW